MNQPDRPISSKNLTSLEEDGIRQRHARVEQAGDKWSVAKDMGYLSHLDRGDLLAEIERLRAALQKLSEIRALGQSTLGSLHGAGLEMAYGVVRDFAKKALSGDGSVVETTAKTIGAQRFSMYVDDFDGVLKKHLVKHAADDKGAWVQSEDYEALRRRFEQACARVAELESAEETTDELTCEVCGNPLNDHSGTGLECPLPPEYPIPPGEEYDKSKWRAEKASAPQCNGLCGQIPDAACPVHGMVATLLQNGKGDV